MARITYISNSIIPSRAANSVHVTKMCNAFAAEDHKVVLLAPDRSDEYEPGVNDIYSFYNVNKTFEVRKLAWPAVKGRSLFYAMACALKIHRNAPDIVFGRHVQGCALAAWMGIPTIYEAHTPVWDSRGSAYPWFKVLKMSPNFRKLVVITDALKQAYLTHEAIDPKRIHVAHDAAERPQEVVPFEEPLGREGALQVGYVGHLYPGKGMGLIARIVPRMPEVDFHIVGGLEKDLAEWKKNLREPNVYFHGFVNQKQVVQYLDAFDICLLPNQRTVRTYAGGDLDIGAYTSPLKMFEYMSMGKTIVASNLPVLREVLEDGRNSLLCDPEDPSEWVEALEYLRSNADERRRLEGEAQLDFSSRYTWRARAKSVLEGIV